MQKLKNLFSRLRKSKDGKVLAENFLSLSVLQAISYIFPFITMPYLARVIGIDSFGKIAFAASIVTYFQTLVVFGFNYTAVRDIAQNRNDIQKVSEIFSNVMCSKIFLMFVSVIIFVVLLFSIPLFYENRLILCISLLLLPGSIMFPDWLFQAMEKMKYITIMNFFAKLLFTLLVFVVIKEKSDFIYEPLLTALGYFVSGLLALIFARKMFHIKFIVPSLKTIMTTIKQNFNMFISVFLPNLYTNFSVTLLGLYGGDVATGIYSSGKKFVDVCDQILSVLSRTFFPFLARKIDKHKLYVKISGSLSIFMGVCLFLSADLLVKIFYTPEFKDAATIMRIMSVAPFFLFLMNTYGTNYIVLKGREDILRNIILCCSIVGFIVAWIAVLKLNYIGVAITITIVWGIRGLLTWFYANRLKNKEIKN